MKYASSRVESHNRVTERVSRSNTLIHLRILLLSICQLTRCSRRMPCSIFFQHGFFSQYAISASYATVAGVSYKVVSLPPPLTNTKTRPFGRTVECTRQSICVFARNTTRKNQGSNKMINTLCWLGAIHDLHCCLDAVHSG